MIVFPNPAQGEFSIAFNLEQRASLELRIIDSMGRVIWDNELSEVLNQTLEVQLNQAVGVYILQAVGPGFSATRRIIVLK
jgi:hypothetical protein